MTNNATYQLSNLSAGQFIEFNPAGDVDVLAAAQAHLRNSGLPSEVQQGFYLSVFPAGESGPTTSEIASPPVGHVSDTSPGITGPESGASSDADDQAASPLSLAAAQGPLHWTDDSEIDPPVVDQPTYIGIPLGSAGGH